MEEVEGSLRGAGPGASLCPLRLQFLCRLFLIEPPHSASRRFFLFNLLITGEGLSNDARCSESRGLGGGIGASLQYLSVDARKNAEVLFLACKKKNKEKEKKTKP